MPVLPHAALSLSPLEMEGVKDASGINVIGPEQGWDSHTMRLFRIAPGGHTPRHQHDWEHINHVVSGRGRLRIGDTIHELTEKDFALVPSNTEHQFENPYGEPFEFICIVPQRAYADEDE